jgi:hypothetical protein
MSRSYSLTQFRMNSSSSLPFDWWCLSHSSESRTDSFGSLCRSLLSHPKKGKDDRLKCTNSCRCKPFIRCFCLLYSWPREPLFERTRLANFKIRLLIHLWSCLCTFLSRLGYTEQQSDHQHYHHIMKGDTWKEIIKPTVKALIHWQLNKR